MRKQVIVLFICLILTSLSLIGCLGENKNNDNSVSSSSEKFIGTWYGWEHYPDFYAKWTFYENNSMKIDDLFSIEWGTYKINGNEIDIKTPFTGFDDEFITKTYRYKFNEGDQNLTLTDIYFEKFVTQLYRDGYEGEFYQKISNFIGKWSNQTLHENYGNYGDWIEYRNYTFYPNFTVRGEYNWCSSGAITWHSFLYDFILDEPGKIKIGSMIAEYNFSEGNTVLNYLGRKYYKLPGSFSEIRI